MIKYIIQNDCAFSYNTDTEDLGTMKYAYFPDFLLVEKDGELTIRHKDGSKQVMQVVEGDLIASTWVKGQKKWIIVKDANLTEVVKEIIHNNIEPTCECCNDVKSVA